MQSKKYQSHDEIIDRSWSRMRKMLDKEMPTKRRNRSLVLWWVLGSVILFTTIFSLKRTSDSKEPNPVPTSASVAISDPSPNDGKNGDLTTTHQSQNEILQEVRAEEGIERVMSKKQGEEVSHIKTIEKSSDTRTDVIVKQTVVREDIEHTDRSILSDVHTRIADEHMKLNNDGETHTSEFRFINQPVHLSREIVPLGLPVLTKELLIAQDPFAGMTGALVGCCSSSHSIGFYSSVHSHRGNSLDGYELGLIVESSFREKWRLTGKLTWSRFEKEGFNNTLGYDSYDLKNSFPEELADFNESLSDAEVTYIVDKLSYINLDVNIGREIISNLDIYTGLGVSRLVKATNHSYERTSNVALSELSISSESSYLVDNELINIWDSKVQVGLSYKWKRWRLNTEYNHGLLGLLNLADDGSLSTIGKNRDRNRSFEAGLGYVF